MTANKGLVIFRSAARIDHIKSTIKVTYHYLTYGRDTVASCALTFSLLKAGYSDPVALDRVHSRVAWEEGNCRASSSIADVQSIFSLTATN